MSTTLELTRKEDLSVLFQEVDPARTTQEVLNFYEAVLGLSKRLHRLYVKACNQQLTNYEEQAIEQLCVQIKAHFDGLGLGLYLNSDPRGNHIGIKTPKSGRYNTLGGAEAGWRI